MPVTSATGSATPRSRSRRRPSAPATGRDGRAAKSHRAGSSAGSASGDAEAERPRRRQRRPDREQRHRQRVGRAGRRGAGRTTRAGSARRSSSHPHRNRDRQAGLLQPADRRDGELQRRAHLWRAAKRADDRRRPGRATRRRHDHAARTSPQHAPARDGVGDEQQRERRAERGHSACPPAPPSGATCRRSSSYTPRYQSGGVLENPVRPCQRRRRGSSAPSPAIDGSSTSAVVTSATQPIWIAPETRSKRRGPTMASSAAAMAAMPTNTNRLRVTTAAKCPAIARARAVRVPEPSSAEHHRRAGVHAAGDEADVGEDRGELPDHDRPQPHRQTPRIERVAPVDHERRPGDARHQAIATTVYARYSVLSKRRRPAHRRTPSSRRSSPAELCR